MYELIYTSAQRGLRPGVSGFCSVAWTRGTPAELVSLVEKLSAYKLLIPAHSPDASLNPVEFRYLRLRVGTRPLLIISRIAFAGFDYTNRSNILAHHLFFDQPEELSALPGGAVAICLAKENFVTSWEGEPRILEPRAPATVPLPFQGDTWKQLAGDSNWCNLAAENFLRHDRNSLEVEFPWQTTNGQTLLQLAAEVSTLLPANELPGFTFSTYYTQSAANAECFLRFCASGSESPSSTRLRNSSFFASLLHPSACPQVDFPLVRSVKKSVPDLPTKVETTESSSEESANSNLGKLPLPISRAQRQRSTRETPSAGKSHTATALQVPSHQSSQKQLRIALLLIVLIGGLAGVFVALQVGRGHTPTSSPASPSKVESHSITPATLPASPTHQTSPIEAVPSKQDETSPDHFSAKPQTLEALPEAGHLELTSDNALVYRHSPQEEPFLDNLTILGPGDQPLSQLSAQWQKQWQMVQEASRQLQLTTELRKEKQVENEVLQNSRTDADFRLQNSAAQLKQTRQKVLQQLKMLAGQITPESFEQERERLLKSWTLPTQEQPERAGGLPTGNVRRQECNALLLVKEKKWNKVQEDYIQDVKLTRSRLCLELYQLLQNAPDSSPLSLDSLIALGQLPVRETLLLLKNVIRIAPTQEQKKQLANYYNSFDKLLDLKSGIFAQFHQANRIYRRELASQEELKHKQLTQKNALDELLNKETQANQKLQEEIATLHRLVNTFLPTECHLPDGQVTPEELKNHLAVHLDQINIRRIFRITEGADPL